VRGHGGEVGGVGGGEMEGSEQRNWEVMRWQERQQRCGDEKWN